MGFPFKVAVKGVSGSSHKWKYPFPSASYQVSPDGERVNNPLPSPPNWVPRALGIAGQVPGRVRVALRPPIILNQKCSMPSSSSSSSRSASMARPSLSRAFQKVSVWINPEGNAGDMICNALARTSGLAANR